MTALEAATSPDENLETDAHCALHTMQPLQAMHATDVADSAVGSWHLDLLD